MTPAELLKKYPPKVLARAARAERKKRERKGTTVKFDVETFAGGHEPQLAAMRDRSNWIHLMCARQSGKTWACDGIMLDNALSTPGSTNLLLHLSGTAVRRANWFSIWRPLCRSAGVPESWHNETTMTTTFPSGSRVMFAGTDDLRNVKGYLGNSLPGGVVVLDESADQPDAIIAYVIDTLLPPMMTATTRVIVAGVLPDVEAGKFLELADDKSFAHHGWGRAANVHTPDAMAWLEKHMVEKGLTENDPQIARDWFLRRVWLKDALAYGYDRDRNGYQPIRAPWEDELRAELEALGIPIQCLMAAVPNPGVDTFSFAVDPGGGDRFPVQFWGWGKGAPKLQHVFDFTPPRNAGLSWGRVAVVLQAALRHYPTRLGYYDAGGSDVELDVFHRDTGIPVLKAAKKSDAKGQIRRVKNLFAEKHAEVMIGSALEEDYRKACRDPSAPINGPWKWAPAWHPDPSEAARYALAPYWDTYKPPEQAKPALTPYEEAMARMKEAAKKQGRIGYHAQQLRRGGQGGSSWS